MGAFSIPIGVGRPHSGDLRGLKAVVDAGAIDSKVQRGCQMPAGGYRVGDFR